MHELKITEELSVMTLKNDKKFEKELTCRFKIDLRNLTNFDIKHKNKNLKNLHLMSCF